MCACRPCARAGQAPSNPHAPPWTQPQTCLQRAGARLDGLVVDAAQLPVALAAAVKQGKGAGLVRSHSRVRQRRLHALRRAVVEVRVRREETIRVHVVPGQLVLLDVHHPCSSAGCQRNPDSCA